MKDAPRVELHHGDCLEIMPTLPAGSVQMVFADMPYRSKKQHSTECHWDVAIDLPRFWLALEPAISVQSPCIFTAVQPFTTHLITSRIDRFRQTLVWAKGSPGNFMQAKYEVMRWHEDVVVFFGKRGVYNPQMESRVIPVKKTERSARSMSGGVRKPQIGWTRTYDKRHPSSIIVASTRTKGSRGLHPTQKPVALIEWLICTYSNEGDTVLDPTMGSGTTGVACLRTGRNFVGIEKDATYIEVARKRIAEEQARLGLRVTA